MSNPLADPAGANEARNEKRSGRVVTGAELAIILGYHANSVEQWKRQGMPVKREGSKGVPHRYDTAECIQWLIRREVERVTAELQARYGLSGGIGQPGESGGAESDTNLAAKPLDYKDRLGLAKARQAELEITLAEGKVVQIADVERVLSGMAAGVRSRLLSLPVRLARQMAALTDETECRQALDKEIAEALTEISKIDPVDFLSESAAELAGKE